MKKRLIAIFLTITILASLYILNEKYRPFEPGRYNKVVLAMRLINWNLRDLDEYPEHMIIRIDTISDSETYYNVAVYPSLDEKLEKRIRALGYPYNYDKIRYYATDNIDDAQGQKHPLGIDIGGSWWKEYIDQDAEVYEWAYESFATGKRSFIHRLLYNPLRK